MIGAIHNLPTAARGIYIVVYRPNPERSRFGDILGCVARCGKDRWKGFGLNSLDAADVRCLGPLLCTERRRYEAGEFLYRNHLPQESERAA